MSDRRATRNNNNFFPAPPAGRISFRPRKRSCCIFTAVVVLAFSVIAHAAPDAGFKLAQAEHRGATPLVRTLFEKGIAEDPDYPMYYYNLACADAEEKNLSDARKHLIEAYARKANVNVGESMPDPTKDDSFLPYQSNKDFWTFLSGLK